MSIAQALRRTKRLELVLPFPPTTNNLYINQRRGGRALSEKGRKYHATVAKYVLQQKANVMFTEKLRMKLIFYPPDNRRRDLSNFVKALEDGMKNAGVYQDDSLIDDLHLVRGETRGFACVNVTIEKIL